MSCLNVIYNVYNFCLYFTDRHVMIYTLLSNNVEYNISAKKESESKKNR